MGVGADNFVFTALTRGYYQRAVLIGSTIQHTVHNFYRLTSQKMGFWADRLCNLSSLSVDRWVAGRGAKSRGYERRPSYRAGNRGAGRVPAKSRGMGVRYVPASIRVYDGRRFDCRSGDANGLLASPSAVSARRIARRHRYWRADRRGRPALQIEADGCGKGALSPNIAAARRPFRIDIASSSGSRASPDGLPHSNFVQRVLS